jgi:hypothetical protein
MASLKDKLAIQEDLSNAFIDENAKTYVQEYSIHLNTLQAKAIDQVERGIQPTQKSLFKRVRITGINRNIRNAFILGNVNQLIQNDRDRRLIRQLRPIKTLMALYSVKNPKLFASKVDKLVKRSLGKKIPLNPREAKAYTEMDRFLNQNKKQIQVLIDQQTKAMRVINKNITTNQSRTIIKRRNKLIKERITVKGVTRPLTNKEIATRLRSEFKDDSVRLKRILETEVHRQNELVREVTAKGLGFEFKIWNTQRDSKVRKGHEEIDRKKIPINKKFKVNRYKKKKGAWIKIGFDMMEQPGDSTAHVDNVVHCRCFSTYTN